MSDQIPHFRFARDWYQYTQPEIDLILDAMREKVRLTHEEHYRLTSKNRRPPAADRSLLLAVLADVVTHQWAELDQLKAQLTQLTQAVARLQQGPTPDEQSDEPDAYDDRGDGAFESPGQPL